MNLEDYEPDLIGMSRAIPEDKPPLSLITGHPDMLLRDRMMGSFFLEVLRLRDRVEELELRVS